MDAVSFSPVPRLWRFDTLQSVDNSDQTHQAKKTQPSWTILPFKSVCCLSSSQRMRCIIAVSAWVRSETGPEHKGDLTALTLHSLSSGLKCLSTELAAGGIEICRRSMGWQGYGGGSGLVGLNADYLAKPTVEGDNWMIIRQMAKHLIKKAKLVAAIPRHHTENRTEETMSRFWQRRSGGKQRRALDVFTNDSDILEAFEHRAAFLVRELSVVPRSRRAFSNKRD